MTMANDIFNDRCEKCNAILRHHDSMYFIGVFCSNCGYLNRYMINHEMKLVKENKTQIKILEKQMKEQIEKRLKENKNNGNFKK